jgi:ABC-type antimicrobial peptide transport system ATPase subunit
MIALALSCDPAVLVADEPTTALDVTIQAQILRLISRLNQEQDVATILISLVDGLWLEQCIDQSLLSLDRAKDLCRRTLAAVLAPQPARRPT